LYATVCSQLGRDPSATQETGDALLSAGPAPLPPGLRGRTLGLAGRENTAHRNRPP
jgi:hypothetical protein